jgi:hypothetical protein
MKKLLMLLAILIVAVSANYAQDNYVSVTWPEDECSCYDQGNSYYGVKVVIYDDANDVLVISGKEVRVDFGTYTVNVPVPEVIGHCEDQSLPLAPAYKVWVDVAVFCDMYSPIESICNTDLELQSNIPCSEFANNDVEFPMSNFQ